MNDPENIIRQHLAIQLLPVCLTCIGVPLTEEGGAHIPPAPRSDYLIPNNNDKISTFSGKFYEKGYKSVKDFALPHLSKLVSDVDHDVRKAASDTIASLAAYLHSSDVTDLVLPIAFRLADITYIKSNPAISADAEDLRISSVTLLAELSRAVSSEILTEKILPTLAPLSQDSGFRVRKAVVQAIPRVIAYADLLDIKTYLLPLYDSLSRDDMYRVRKACAESMVEISGGIVLVSNRREDIQLNNVLHLRRTVLIPVCTRLLGDSNRFVRHGMMQFLGPFIASFFPLEHISSKLSDSELPNYFPHLSPSFSSTNQTNETHSALKIALTSDLMLLDRVFQQRNLHPPNADDLDHVIKELIPHFSSMAVLHSGDANTDAEMRVHCAYSLPAALILLGREEWDLLRGCFFALVNGSGGSLAGNGTTSVPSGPGAPVLAAKRCLASSLHTLAHILGPEIVEAELLQTFSQSFLRDPDEHTRLNTLKNLSSFLAVLTPKARETFLPVLLEFKNSALNQRLNWRLRNIVAKQLSLLITLFDAKVVRTYLIPLMCAFVKDSVAQVREQTFVCVPVLLLAFSPEKIDNIVKETQYSHERTNEDLQEWATSVAGDIVKWLREELGRNENDFCMRQAFCRICAAIAMAINEDPDTTERKITKHNRNDSDTNSTFGGTGTAYTDDASSMGDTIASNAGSITSSKSNRYTITRKGRKYLHKILVHDLISTALRMKDDSVSNVRLTLFKCLRVMPNSVRSLLVVNVAMRQLAEELNTWDVAEGGGWKVEAPNYPKQSKKKRNKTANEESDVTKTSNLSTPKASYSEGHEGKQSSSVGRAKAASSQSKKKNDSSTKNFDETMASI